MKYTVFCLIVSAAVMQGATKAEVLKTQANNGNLLMEDVPTIPASIKEDLKRFQNTRSAPLRAWSSNGESIFVTTRFGDVAQLHRIDQPGGVRKQITFFDEPIGGVTRQPEGDGIAFTMDAGGSENAQVFLLNPTSGEVELLSDGESRNGALSWRRDGKAIAYQSTRRDGAANDLWLTQVNEDGTRGESSLILKSDDGSWWGAGDWNADGSKMLVQQYVSVTDSRIFLLDLETGELTQVGGSSQQPSVNYTVAFDAKGAGHYFLTDAGGGFAQLAYQAFDESEAQIITSKINWDVESATINPARDQLAFAVNQGGTSQVYLLDTKNNEYAAVKGLPLGLASGLAFSPSGNQLGLTLNTAQSPSDSYVLELDRNRLKHGALTRWSISEVGGLDTTQFVSPELIEYPTFDQVNGQARKIPAFVYRPTSGQGKRPVIISIHGGPESQYRPRFSSTIQLWVNKLGAAVIAPNVRGSSGYGRDYVSLDNGFKREDSVKDIGALLDWIKTQPDLDSERVIVFGGSYGGYMVLASAVHYSERLLGAVDIVGISNFVTFLKNTKDYRRDLRRVEYGDERDPAMYEHLQKISPNNNVEKIKIPMFVVQGNNDPRVPVSESEQIVAALREQGNTVWYMNALNEGHGFRKKENRDIYQQAVVLFFQQVLADPGNEGE